MIRLVQDLRPGTRYAVRQLWKNLGFSMTAILSLACGIAATTAVFSVVWAVLMQPFPYAHSERLAHFALGDFRADGMYQNFGLLPSQWQQLRAAPGVEDSVLVGEQALPPVADGIARLR